MIVFDEEIKKFKPSLEIENTESVIKKEEETDMVTLMVELMREYRLNR